MKKALIAMSGGVDSSVSAHIMIKRGYDCMGTTMRLYENDMIGEDLLSTCCSLKDTNDARAVCDKIGIPFKILHYENLFREEVMEDFVSNYEAGLTPNPCIVCNKRFKFGRLIDKMEEFGMDYVVTGHYARIYYNEETKRYVLKKAVDLSKDQSYVLYNMSQEQLAHTIFPLGEYTKSEVREIAIENDFVNAKKHESQDICFVPDGDYVAFMERFRKKSYEPGEFVDLKGNVIGKHKGYVHYTIGQRKGLGIAMGHPVFVVDINPKENKVVIGESEDLFNDTLIADNINLISVPDLYEPRKVKAKIRYAMTEQEATVRQLDDNRIEVKFDRPQRAITKGQAVVLYDGEDVVGGGRIIDIVRN
ncbi:tRNA 2-thiouridine(34) synthase MnmA [Lachnospira sp.]|uniref:tRNA 2-thiouridine(34) synthase MnmA n=1 Tax=Lachnospira sp. TaxID=2049031 RepID=UPI00257B4A24|nr:tRNA 2-thiouridine(34) synthase MnmA [Lachnospira sp.]